MNRSLITRRDALRSIGGAFAAGSVGLEVRAEPDGPSIVDAHVHLVEANLPGSPKVVSTNENIPLAPFRTDEARTGFARLIADQMTSAGVGHMLGMPRVEVSDADPLGISETLALANLIKGPRLHAVGLIHPERFDADHMDKVETVLKTGRVKALKAYLGYMHYGPSWRGYMPYYELAATHNVPVIFHTGDTYSKTAKVKYAHPLYIDEVAVDFPKTKFVMAHFGNPWIMDAAELVYKNENVWADLSGILVGDAKVFADMKKDGSLARVVARITQGIAFSESPKCFLFGSDWPLAPVNVYRDFVRMMFHENDHEAVFQTNATQLFRLA